MKKIVPHLWFDTQAKEAANLYVDSFGNGSKILHHSVIKDTPSGDCDFFTINLLGEDFQLISAGPYFKLNPSISFAVALETTDEVDALHAKLSKDGKILMELAEYPFSKRYSWIEDKYGVSWQIMHSAQAIVQKITPTLMFVGGVCGKSEEAINFYTSIFKNAQPGFMIRYEEGEAPDKAGTIRYGAFQLEGQQFASMDSARMHDFGFNEAVSLIVRCESQEEIDYYWEKLSAVPESEQCGWLKDRFGVSWQITPIAMEAMMQSSNPEQLARVTQSFLKMKKFDVAELQRAYEGK